MSSSCGVTSGFAAVMAARYWMNCEVSAIAPPDVIGAKALHVASGAGVLPPRTPIARVVPAGVVARHWMLFQLTGNDASNTRDRNVPLAAYGDIRIQSTNTVPPNALKSLAATGRMAPTIVSAWLATSVPST